MSWFESYPYWSLTWGLVGLGLLLWITKLRKDQNLRYEKLCAWLLPFGWGHLALSIPLFKEGIIIPVELKSYYTGIAILLTLEMLPLFLGTFTAVAVAKKYHHAEFDSLFLNVRPRLEPVLLPLWVVIQCGFIGIYWFVPPLV